MSLSKLMNKGLDLKRSTVATTATGAYEETFATVARIKAAVQPMGAAELVKLGREATEHGIVVYTKRTDVVESDRLVYSGRTFRVDGVRNFDEANRLVRVDCTEIL